MGSELHLDFSTDRRRVVKTGWVVELPTRMKPLLIWYK